MTKDNLFVFIHILANNEALLGSLCHLVFQVYIQCSVTTSVVYTNWMTNGRPVMRFPSSLQPNSPTRHRIDDQKCQKNELVRLENIQTSRPITTVTMTMGQNNFQAVIKRVTLSETMLYI